MFKQKLSLLLILWLLSFTAFAQEGFSPFTTDFAPAEFAARRAERRGQHGTSSSLTATGRFRATRVPQRARISDSGRYTIVEIPRRVVER